MAYTGLQYAHAFTNSGYDSTCISLPESVESYICVPVPLSPKANLCVAPGTGVGAVAREAKCIVGSPPDVSVGSVCVSSDAVRSEYAIPLATRSMIMSGAIPLNVDEHLVSRAEMLKVLYAHLYHLERRNDKLQRALDCVSDQEEDPEECIERGTFDEHS